MRQEDHEGTDLPVCPQCGTVDQDWWDGQPNRNDGDTWTATCGECGSDYAVTLYVETSFSTAKEGAGAR